MLQVNVVLQNNTMNFKNLYELYSEKGLIVLAVPSNQFGGQEPGSNEAEIKEFL